MHFWFCPDPEHPTLIRPPKSMYDETAAERHFEDLREHLARRLARHGE